MEQFGGRMVPERERGADSAHLDLVDSDEDAVPIWEGDDEESGPKEKSQVC